MDHSLAQIILIAGNSDGEDTIWMQMLVFVVLAASFGVYSLVKTRAKQSGVQKQYYPAGVRNPQTRGLRQIKRLKELKDKCVGIFLKTAQPKAVTEEHLFDLGAADTAGERKRKSEPGSERDLTGGMEMLKLDFLLGVIEKTESNDQRDVMMRKLGFNELMRREQLKAVDSNALKVYAMDEGNLYGESIQCGAMKELTERTALQSERNRCDD